MMNVLVINNLTLLIFIFSDKLINIKNKNKILKKILSTGIKKLPMKEIFPIINNPSKG